MTTGTFGASGVSSRRVPPLGGLNLTALSIEVRRLLRNKRTAIFAVIMPCVLFLAFGLNKAYANQGNGRGTYGNVSAFILISMALYGSVLATTSGGAMVSIERAAGWSRQLRLTPLAPPAYIFIKMLTAMVLGAASVLAVFIVGVATGKPSMPVWLWIVSALCVWVGSLIFAAFGLFMGYLLPTENAMQFLGFALLLFSFGGGLFIPLSQFPHVLQVIAEFTPLYGLNQLVHAPLLNGSVHVAWVGNAVAWLVIFAGGAAWRFRKDTGRV
ncbi:MAG TPA: ABC transporter permease [Streptosporangiaceae bacterium]|jgi:ABC-2 type transport system permease protein|nr:ABC transporter permease [Streptosporangiaceae bacterium]